MDCLFKETKVVDAAGDVHLDIIYNRINEWDDEIKMIMTNILDKCRFRPEGNDTCERAFQMHKCWKTVDPRVIKKFRIIFELF